MNSKEIKFIENALVDRDEWEAVECIRYLQSRLESLEKTKESLCKALDEAGDSLIEAGAKIQSLEKDAARWREVLTNDAFVVCDESGSEYRKCKLEAVVDSMKG